MSMGLLTISDHTFKSYHKKLITQHLLQHYGQHGRGDIIPDSKSNPVISLWNVGPVLIREHMLVVNF